MRPKTHKRSATEELNDFLQNQFDFEEYHEKNNRRAYGEDKSKRTFKRYYLIAEKADNE